jgi:predicted Zn-dependent protease
VTFDELSVKDEGSVREVARSRPCSRSAASLTIAESGSGGGSRKHFESARAISPEDPRIKAGLGLVAYRENREGDATKLLDAAADAGVEDASALTAAGRLALHRDDDARARDLASRALAIRPADADLLALYGLSFVGETGDAAQGIAALEKADLIDPGRGDVLSGLVALCAQSRDRAKAEAAAKRAEAFESSPRCPSTSASRSRASM